MNAEKPYLSIVSPVFGAVSLLDELVERICSSAQKIHPHFEIILIDDRSPNNAWTLICQQAQNIPQVKGIRLSRNFGQHYAIAAGLKHASGEWVVVMDCDLQDQPEEIVRLHQKALEGYEIVLASRSKRQDSLFKRWFSKLFYRILSYLTGVNYDSSIANFGIYHQKVIQSINQLKEHIRFFPAMIKWVGFNSTQIEVAHAPRLDGKSSYNLGKLLRLGLDIMLAYSDKPLRLTIKLGLGISALSVLFFLITLFRYFQGKIIVPGYASLILSIWFLSGLIIFVLGMVGLYVGKTFEGIKARPIYIVDEKINL